MEGAPSDFSAQDLRDAEQDFDDHRCDEEPSFDEDDQRVSPAGQRRRSRSPSRDDSGVDDDDDDEERRVRQRTDAEADADFGIDAFEKAMVETPMALQARAWDVPSLERLIDEMAARWALDRDAMAPSETITWACHLFGIPEADLALSANAVNTPHPAHILRKITSKVTLLITLLGLIQSPDIVPGKADADDMVRRLGEVASIVHNAQEVLRSTCRLMCSLTAEAGAADPYALGNRFLHLISGDQCKLTPLQQLLIDLNETLLRNGWRQYDGRYYVPITVDVGGELMASHAFEECLTIEEMVSSLCCCNLEHRRWLLKTSGRDTTRQAAIELMRDGPWSHEFPTIEFDRRLFAFTDGCYDASTDIFWPHAERGLAAERVAIKFFPHAFGCGRPTPPPRHRPALAWAHQPVEAEFMLAHLSDLEDGFDSLGHGGLRPAVRRLLMQSKERPASVDAWVARIVAALKQESPADRAGLGERLGGRPDVQVLARHVWRHHPGAAHLCHATDRMDGVLFTQGYDLSMCSLVYAMIGKMLYQVNELDAWQTVPFIIGKGGTGKSTLLKLARHFYPTRFVANISSNGEVKFGLSAVYGKLFWLCPEVKKSFCMDQGDFQSMVSGEEMSIAKKHETARTVRWDAPGILSGNEVFAFEDTQESLFRRIIALYFNCAVAKTSINTLIFEEMIEGDTPEFGALLRKCNMAYRQMVAQIGERDIWDMRLVEEGAVPRCMHTFRTKFRAEIDSVVAFLEESDCIHAHPARCMSIKSVYTQFKGWMNTHDATKRGTACTEATIRDKLEMMGFTIAPAASGFDMAGFTYSDPESFNQGNEQARGTKRDLVLGLYYTPAEIGPLPD